VWHFRCCLGQRGELQLQLCARRTFLSRLALCSAQLKLQEDGSVQRVRWVTVGGGEKLVAVAQSSVQVWNSDGSLLYLCWALPPPPAGFTASFHASSIAAVTPTESIYVGASSGDLFVFSVAADMLSYKQTASAHGAPVTCLAANDAAAPSVLVSGDSSGEIRVWDTFTMSTTVQIAGSGCADPSPTQLNVHSAVHAQVRLHGCRARRGICDRWIRNGCAFNLLMYFAILTSTAVAQATFVFSTWPRVQNRQSSWRTCESRAPRQPNGANVFGRPVAQSSYIRC